MPRGLIMEPAIADYFYQTAHLLDLIYFVEDQIFNLLGQRFDIKRARQGIHDLRNLGFRFQYLLGSQGNQIRLVRRHRVCFIISINMQRLRTAKGGGKGMVGGSGDIG
eukprot:TRINITY_DN18307_c0_g1_i1.p2 TRINITY_DN18307_c0_g1~~TRINITY_DN18307_c0_g1_i1.p2  ORF type:complete len:108 (-),score=1.12 TRINITY_DN18307_c0_g1_i1:1179-1502(-)